MELKQTLTVRPCEHTALHSYIDEKMSWLDYTIRYGPIPDVLVSEVVYELQERHEQYVNSVLGGFKGDTVI